jgi:hypothetical protein
MDNLLTGAERAWLQLDEIHEDFAMLNNEDLIDCREVIQKRVEKALKYLEPYVRDDMSEFEADGV